MIFKPNRTKVASAVRTISAFAFAAITLTTACSRERAPHPVAPKLQMPGQITGKVIHVDDGDTLIMLDDQGFKRVIRLSDIDAPETSHGAKRGLLVFSAISDGTKS